MQYNWHKFNSGKINFECWKSFPKLWGLQTDFDLFAENSSPKSIKEALYPPMSDATETESESKTQSGKNEEPRKARQWIERIETNKDRMVLSDMMFEMISNDDKITKDRVETLMECGSRFLLEWRLNFLPILNIYEYQFSFIYYKQSWNIELRVQKKILPNFCFDSREV